VRQSDFWERLTTVLDPAYAPTWASHVVLPDLGVTVEQAFAQGIETSAIWRSVCSIIEVPSNLT